MDDNLREMHYLSPDPMQLLGLVALDGYSSSISASKCPALTARAKVL
jgi:hypothetical protein